MPIQANVSTDSLDLEQDSEQLVASVMQFAVATVQVTVLTGAWNSAELGVQRSNDGIAFEDLEEPVTITAEGMTSRIDVSGFSYLRVRVTSEATGAGTGQVTIVGKGS